MAFTALLDYMSSDYVYDYVPVDFHFVTYYPLCITVVFCSVHDDSVGAEHLALLPCRRAADKHVCFE